MVTEQTLVLLKPDALKKSLTGNILTCFSETKLKIVGAKIVRVDKKLAEQHYAHLKDKQFYPELIKYITGKLHGGDSRVMALVYHGENAIREIKEACGATNPELADPVTIRGKYGRVLSSGVFENVVHASGNAKEAEKEIKLWFRPEELAVRIYPTKRIFCRTCGSNKLVWA